MYKLGVASVQNSKSGGKLSMIWSQAQYDLESSSV